MELVEEFEQHIISKAGSKAKKKEKLAASRNITVGEPILTYRQGNKMDPSALVIKHP